MISFRLSTNILTKTTIEINSIFFWSVIFDGLFLKNLKISRL